MIENPTFLFLIRPNLILGTQTFWRAVIYSCVYSGIIIPQNNKITAWGRDRKPNVSLLNSPEPDFRYTDFLAGVYLFLRLFWNNNPPKNKITACGRDRKPNVSGLITPNLILGTQTFWRAVIYSCVDSGISKNPPKSADP